MSEPSDKIEFPDLNERARTVFQNVVENYLESGDPVGSRTLARGFPEKISPATIRNVMQDLEFLGLLEAPHASAGRIPTQIGLRMFVDGFMEVGGVPGEARTEIQRSLEEEEDDIPGLMDRAGQMLSGLTQGASLVLAPKSEAPIKHFEFVPLSADRALAVLVTADGHVENRVFHPPAGMTPSAMREAANFLNAILEGHTITEARGVIQTEIAARRQELDSLTAELIATGSDIWIAPGEDHRDRLIVRGRANLLGETATEAELERVRQLFDDLERKRDLEQLLELAETGEGVRIFIGSENKLFSLSGSALVVSPYMNAERKIIGAVGVIGPTRLNYGRIVPIVDYTAQLVGRIVARRG